MKRIKEDIRDGAFEPVYLIYGPEARLRRNLKQALREALTGGEEMNYTYREGKNVVFSEIRDMAETMPFFAEKRLIVLENTELFLHGGDEMADYLPELPPTAVLVFVEETVDKRTRLYKAVQKCGYAAECRNLTDEELEKAAIAGFARQKVRITREALDLFLDRCGGDLDTLYSEQEKLISYALGRDGIRPEDVEAVTSVTAQNRVFDMLDAVTAGNPERAFELYRELQALREPPMRILYLLSQQVNRLLQVKEGLASGKTQDQLAEEMGLRVYPVRKYAGQARRFGEDVLRARLGKLIGLEEAVKTGELADTMAVELALTELSGR